MLQRTAQIMKQANETGHNLVMMRTLLLTAGDIDICHRGIITPLRIHLRLSLVPRLTLFGR